MPENPDFSEYTLVADRAALRGALPRIPAPSTIGTPSGIVPAPGCVDASSSSSSADKYTPVVAGNSTDWIDAITSVEQRTRIFNLSRLSFDCAECGQKNVSRLLSIGRRGCYMHVTDAAFRRYNFRVAADHRPATVHAWTAGGNDTYNFQNTVLALMPDAVKPPESARVAITARANNQYKDMIKSSTAYSRYDIRAIRAITGHIRMLAPRYGANVVGLFQEFDYETSARPWAAYRLTWPGPGQSEALDNPLIECAPPINT